MNFLALLSLLITGAVFSFAVIEGVENPRVLLDPHGMVIVIAGSLSCISIAFQLNRSVMMIKIFFVRLLRGKAPDYRGTIMELMMIAEAYRKGNTEAQALTDKSKDLFLKEAMAMLLDAVVDPKSLKRVLNNRVETIFNRYNDDAKMFSAMGKYPPALGLMGAVLGMIALLSKLGAPGAEKNIGPSMSIALVATFYGIAFANLVVVPIGENLTEATRQLKIKNVIIIEGVLLIAKKTNPVVLAEELNSFLLPAERVDRKALTAKKA